MENKAIEVIWDYLIETGAATLSYELEKEFVKRITKIRFAIFTSEITVRQFKQEFYFPLWLPDEFRERR